MSHPRWRGSVVRQGVVLAAGRATRLRPISDLQAKPLVPICNKPIMQYQLEAMRDAGITDIAVVVGPTSQDIKYYFRDGSDLGIRLTYIDDPAPAGIAASLSLAEEWVKGPFIVFLGDIFLAMDDLAPALAPMDDGAAGLIVVREDTLDAVRRNFSVELGPTGTVQRVVEKPQEPATNLKGVGVYVFDQTIFEAIKRTPVSPLRNEVEITDAVQHLIDMGRPVWPAQVVRWDVNITYPGDMLSCNLRLLRERNLDNLIDKDATVGPLSHFSSSIVGPWAVVDVPATLQECLVLPGARVEGVAGAVRRSIFADGLVWVAEGA